jgi:site-specific DNA-methyltransferase (cytosine-N4-specific)
VRLSNQESDTRYAAIKKHFESGNVFDSFLAACGRIIRAKQRHMPRSWDCQVIEGSILDKRPQDLAVPIGLVITSPPYPNAYEYWLYHKYRMYWLGYDPLLVKANEIGARAHYFRKHPPTEDDFRDQMTHVFRLLDSLVVSDGHVCFVIGRSKVHGREIDNAQLISSVAEREGFALSKQVSRQISASHKSFNLSHANIKTEDILVFSR